VQASRATAQPRPWEDEPRTKYPKISTWAVPSVSLAEPARRRPEKSRPPDEDEMTQGIRLANFAGSGEGSITSIFWSTTTPPIGSLTMSETTVLATL
jgi:hypothetical protein